MVPFTAFDQPCLKDKIQVNRFRGRKRARQRSVGDGLNMLEDSNVIENAQISTKKYAGESLLAPLSFPSS